MAKIIVNNENKKSTIAPEIYCLLYTSDAADEL